jgi:hypothetical protein
MSTRHACAWIEDGRASDTQDDEHRTQIKYANQNTLRATSRSIKTFNVTTLYCL